MIIDIHGHLGNINQAPFWAADAATLENYLGQAGVDILCVTSSKSIMYDVREGNADLVSALRATKKLLGYVTVNPVFPDSIRDLDLLRRSNDDKKLIGVKIHPDYHGYDIASARAREFLDEVAGQTPLILSHVSCMPGTGFAAAVKVAEFAARHPRTNFVLAHMAGIYQNGLYPYFPNLEGLERVMEMQLPNVYVDTAHFLMYVYPGVMERMVELAGVDRIVFGTDMPLQGPLQARFALEIIRKLPLAAAERDKILGGTAARLIGLDVALGQ
ncbi:MAG: amidohydrolase family protein [Kiritimatiellia bacterium]|jgi:predicted TIM-barrel fold metal-dependent hydrolase